MIGLGGYTQQRSQQQIAMMMQQEQFYALHEHYKRRGMKLVSVYTNGRDGSQKITVERKTTIPKVSR